jgi:hypothetical protein
MMSAYIDQRRYGEAESVTLAAHNALARALGSDHRDAQEVVAHFLDLYSRRGKTDKAAEWRATLPR